MNKITKIATLLAASSIAASAAPSSLSVSYQGYRTGQNYTFNNFVSDMKESAVRGKIGNGDQKIVKFPSSSNYKRLRVQFDSGKFGNDHLIAASKLSRANSYTIEYLFRFADNWQWVRGGKLPGLAGGSHPSGGRPKRDGMTGRFMWRRDNSGSNSTRNYLELYHYWRGQAIAFNNGNNRRRFGDRTFLRTANKNQWYKMKMKVSLGTGSSDGRLECWVNGSKKYDRRHRFLDSRSGWKMDRVAFNFFYGGGDSSWAPSRNTHVFFDNLSVRR